MKLETASRGIITAALLLQLYMLTKNKFICSTAFFMLAFASYLMAYNYYMIDNKTYTERVSFKIFNATLILLIAIISRR